MTGDDIDYIRRLLREGIITDPVLELGTGWGGATSREIITSEGLRYYGTDIAEGEGVDFVANLESTEDVHAFNGVAPFGSILILNVLEHTFDPIRILDNSLHLLKPGGSLVVLTPAVWPLHHYPFDAWRILPSFYEEYAKRRRLKLLESFFEYVGFGLVGAFRNPDPSYSFPRPCTGGFRYWYGRVMHKVFNTFGRGTFFPSHIAIGCVFLIPDSIR